MCTVNEMAIDDMEDDIKKILAALPKDALHAVQNLLVAGEFASWKVKQLVGETPFSI
jgi:hypothetical protein